MQFDLTKQFQRQQFAEKIKADIDEFCRVHYQDERRHHLGGSIIGEECARKLWYGFRWAREEEFSGKMFRLFNRGHETEPRFMLWLEGAGFTVHAVDPETGKQFRIEDCNEHFGGSLDSVATHPDFPGIEFMLEFKSAAAKYFVNIQGFGPGSGVILNQPKHWAQMCVYGYKRGIRYAIYCVVNKNNDDIHIEVLELNWRDGQDLITKANSIINAEEAPPRISDNPAFHKCKPYGKLCFAHDVCHEAAAPDRNCRSCRNGAPVEAGKWRCCHWQSIIPRDKLIEAAQECPHYFAVE
jgi:hypothetical protein